MPSVAAGLLQSRCFLNRSHYPLHHPGRPAGAAVYHWLAAMNLQSDGEQQPSPPWERLGQSAMLPVYARLLGTPLRGRNIVKVDCGSNRKSLIRLVTSARLHTPRRILRSATHTLLHLFFKCLTEQSHNVREVVRSLKLFPHHRTPITAALSSHDCCWDQYFDSWKLYNTSDNHQSFAASNNNQNSFPSFKHLSL